MMNNADYGGFIVSNNIINGVAVGWSYREKSPIPELNGWTLLSVKDDQNYLDDPANYTILTAESLLAISPMIRVMLEIFDAPYGTDLAWMYKEGVLVGFYDLVGDKETTIEEILQGKKGKRRKK